MIAKKHINSIFEDYNTINKCRVIFQKLFPEYYDRVKFCESGDGMAVVCLKNVPVKMEKKINDKFYRYIHKNNIYAYVIIRTKYED